MALVRDKLMIPTKDAPELGYIIESTSKQYVPDVLYKEKDDYGNEVNIIIVISDISKMVFAWG
jgi:nuclear protein localization family protein 4